MCFTMSRVIKISPSYNDSDQISKPRHSSDKDAFYDIFKPMLIVLQMFGLYFDINKPGINRSRWTVSRLYCTAILIIGWLCFGRSLYPFRYTAVFGAELFLKCIGATYVSTSNTIGTHILHSCRL